MRRRKSASGLKLFTPRPWMAPPSSIKATIESATDFGEVVDYEVRFGGSSIRTKTLSTGRPYAKGDKVP